jgi:hypothetical protein
MGYFPCAPVHPSLAIDINLLEFVTIASHHMAPNVLGWANTLQCFLSICGYLIGEKVQNLLIIDVHFTEPHSGIPLVMLWKCPALVSGYDCDGNQPS